MAVSPPEPAEQAVRQMEDDFDEVRHDDSLSPAGKVREWQRFMETYPEEEFSSKRTDELRGRARIRLEYWELEAEGSKSMWMHEAGGGDQSSGKAAASHDAGEENSGEVVLRVENSQENVSSSGSRQVGSVDSRSIASIDTKTPEVKREIGMAGRGAGRSDSRRDFLRVHDSALLRKVVGLRDNIAILDGSSMQIGVLGTLEPYFVLEETSEKYRVFLKRERGDVEGYVAKGEVAEWNTREGLRLVPAARRDRRPEVIQAWISKSAIAKFAASLDVEAYGPDLEENLQEHILSGGDVLPYPLLGNEIVNGLDGKPVVVQNVLIAAKVPEYIETDLTPEQVRDVIGAVTICVVFDAGASMKPYARTFISTLEEMLADISSRTQITLGFVLYHDSDRKGIRALEMVHPMELGEALEWLRERVKDTIGSRSSKSLKPILDAVTKAEFDFKWNNYPAVRGAGRAMIIVSKESAARETMGLERKIPKGRTLEEVAWSLAQGGIRVSTLQAGIKSRGSLREVLRTLSRETGGEFYSAASHRADLKEEFSEALETTINRSVSDGILAAESIAVAERAGGGAVIALGAISEQMNRRLVNDARSFRLAEGDLVVTEAWIFKQPEIYREEVLIETDAIEGLVDFLKGMDESDFTEEDMKESVARILTALAGEEVIGSALGSGVNVQMLLEEAVGTHFRTNIMSYPFDGFGNLLPDEKAILRQDIRAAADSLEDFLYIRRQQDVDLIWMPVSYLP